MLSSCYYNICIFCYKNDNSCETAKYSSGDITQFIKLFSRFVGDNSLVKRLLSLEKQFDILLKCCLECKSVVTTFCQLYQEFECLQMKLVCELNKLVAIINLGGKVPSRVINLNTNLENAFKNNKTSILDGHKVIKSLRQFIKRTGLKRLGESLPKVLLTRQQGAFIGTSSVQIKIDDPLSTVVCSNDNISGEDDPNILPEITVDNFQDNYDDLAISDDNAATEKSSCSTDPTRHPVKSFRDTEEQDSRKEETENISQLERNISPKNVASVVENVTSKNLAVASERSSIADIDINIANSVADEQTQLKNETDNPSESDIIDFDENQVVSECAIKTEVPTCSTAQQRYELREKRNPKLQTQQESIHDFDMKADIKNSEDEYTSETSIESDVSAKPKKRGRPRLYPVGEKSYKRLKQNTKQVNKKVGNKREETRKLFKCCTDSCLQTFYNETVYLNHKKLHQFGKFQCQFCDVNEINLIKLSRHEYKFHTPDEKLKEDFNSTNLRRTAHRWSCPRCSFVCHKLCEYEAHFANLHFGIGLKPEEISKKNKSIPSRTFKWTRPKLESEIVNGVRRFRCPHCISIFYKKRTLLIHIRHQHKSEQKELFATSDLESRKQILDTEYKCNFCEKSCTGAPNLAIHETEHAPDVTYSRKGRGQNKNLMVQMSKCPRCPYKYNIRTVYVKHHLTNHLSIPPSSIPGACTLCSGGKTYIPNTQQHYDKFHNKDLLDEGNTQVSQCDECPAYFIKPFHLILHKSKIHRQNKHKCDFCDKIFTSRERLKEHLNRMHKHFDEDPKLAFGCDMEGCKKRYSSLGELDLHKRFHRNLTPHLLMNDKDENTCLKCGRIYKTKKALAAHKERKDCLGQKLVCEICGKGGFKNITMLSQHLEYHKGPEHWKFQCAECGKKCVNKDKLKQHERVHTKEKPFVCQFCGEKYAHRHNWRNHLKTKHGDEEGAQDDINGRRKKVQQDSKFMSRKGSKKGDCILAGTSTQASGS